MFISYAQHGEDVILWRALGGRDKVTYVDVGAFDPTDDSVTRALYERGWRGVSIEAQADRIAAFEEARPEDVNLALAVGEDDGDATLTLPGNPGWATIREPEQGFATEGEPQHVTVPMRSLGSLLPELGLTHVDVLKIDVEGAEAAVVRGLLSGTVRPTVCVVEGVSPGYGRAAGDEAVALLVEAGYTHCMFDGLNHYLTTDPDLVEALSVPANPLDEFMDVRLSRLIEEYQRLTGPGGGSVARGTGRPERRKETFRRLLGAPGATASGSSVAGSGRQLDPAALERSSPATAITALYRLILGREPDTTGLATWVTRLSDGFPLVSAAREFMRSDEALELPETKRAEARRLMRRWRAYHNLVELGAAGARRRTYRTGHVASEIFVGALYRVGLGRAPSAEELTADVAAAEREGGRDELLRGFARRSEVRDRLRARRAPAGIGRGRGRTADLDDLRARVAREEVRRVAALAVTYADGSDRADGKR